MEDNMRTKGRHILLFTLSTIVLTSVSLFVAAHIVFPPGSTLTCKATFAISENQRVTQTFVHNYPGLLSKAPLGGRLLYSAFIGVIIGLPFSLLLFWLARTPLQRKLSLVGLSIGCLFEYNLESLFVLILNSHHSEQASPFMSYSVPLVAFGVETFFPLNWILNLEAFLLVNVLKPTGVVGIYLLYAFPGLVGLLGLVLAKRRQQSRE